MFIKRSLHVDMWRARRLQLSPTLCDPFAIAILPVKTWCTWCRNSTVH